MNIAELTDWHNEQKCKHAVHALEKNGFTAIYCTDEQDVVNYIVREAENAKTIGFGGSMTIVGLGLPDKLAAMGKELLIHGKPGLSPEERMTVMRSQLTSDLFLTGTNALTLTGCLVNVDASGNRVGSMGFGPGKVIVVAGRNKIVQDIEEALRRVKNHVAPPNARRLGFDTPCSKTGFCSDCNSSQRICRITTIIEKKPMNTDIRVLVVNKNLGF